jgi:hypothetical protein
MRKLVVALLIGVVAACSPQITSTAGSGAPSGAASPGASASPLASPAASEVPSVAPSPTAGATPAPSIGTLSLLPPGSAIEVNVAELNLRSAPSTKASKIETLKKGQVLIVSPYDGVWLGAGPIRKTYTWYPVIKLQVEGPDGGLPPLPTRPVLIGTEVQVGWIAADDKTTSYVRQLPPRCPTTVDLANVQAMLSAERLACFGGQFVLEGTYGCPDCGAELTGDFNPIWLNYPQSLDFLSVNVSEQVGPIVLRFPPGVDNPAGGSIIRATVHVDDAAAAGCSIHADGDDAVPAQTAELFCREQLVVDSYEVIGTDAGFGT